MLQYSYGTVQCYSVTVLQCVEYSDSKFSLYVLCYQLLLPVLTDVVSLTPLVPALLNADTDRVYRVYGWSWLRTMEGKVDLTSRSPGFSFTM